MRLAMSRMRAQCAAAIFAMLLAIGALSACGRNQESPVPPPLPIAPSALPAAPSNAATVAGQPEEPLAEPSMVLTDEAARVQDSAPATPAPTGVKPRLRKHADSPLKTPSKSATDANTDAETQLLEALKNGGASTEDVLRGGEVHPDGPYDVLGESKVVRRRLRTPKEGSSGPK